jgi:selenocysteine lyase/cysteine desulfurase
LLIAPSHFKLPTLCLFPFKLLLLLLQKTIALLEAYFKPYRDHIIGINQAFVSPYGQQTIVYADWTASGRCYGPIEQRMQQEILPLLANTHTETTVTGTAMTQAYETAKKIVKQHVGANDNDVIIFAGSGMTGAVNKLQRILGLRIPERVMEYVKNNQLDYAANGIQAQIARYMQMDETKRPVVFVTHMEHHSNQTSWLETIADVEIIEGDADGQPNLQHLQSLLQKHAHRHNKIAAITGCSNVTGIQTPFHQIAVLLHQHGGLCFVDFACSAPYTSIDMHPANESACLDAIYFSPHKFLGGPGTNGVLIFNKNLYKNQVPDQPGGGTVTYTNPWKYHEFVSDIEHREDGGTPAFLQGIRTAMCIRLKEEMGVAKMMAREEELLRIVLPQLEKMTGISILAGQVKKRLGIISFVVEGMHHNLAVKILNDRFGIQTRGGCACAGTYGHFLLNVDEAKSYAILDDMHKGNMHCKPGWVRASLHPTTTNAEAQYLVDCIGQLVANKLSFAKDYRYNASTNEWDHERQTIAVDVAAWFAASYV